MTIVAFHYTNDSFFAISDGLISRGNLRVVEDTKKILPFKASYKIPRIAMHRVTGFSEYAGGDFYFSYAGNYTLITNIFNAFTSIVSRKLVLDRDKTNGKPMVYQREDEGRGLRNGSYWDDYNFSDDELIPITINFLANILERVVKSCAQDFCQNAMQNPDIELILFGEQTVKHRRTKGAQVIKCKEFAEGLPIIQRFSVLPWSLVCIGDASVIPKAMDAIEEDPEFFTPISVKKKTGVLFGEERKENPHDFLKKRIHVIKKNVMPIILDNVGSIGGSCTIAQSGWASGLEMTTIPNESLELEISKL
jgi:hypothetical protein